MGKLAAHTLPQQQIPREPPPASGQRCPMGVKRIAEEFSFKCLFILILGFAVFVSAVFVVIPHRHSDRDGFDAKQSAKLSATIQAFFKLQKPVTLLVSQIGRLEFDILGEIGVPYTKVGILSMHQAAGSNYTDVVFGVFSDPMNGLINPFSLSMLRSSFIDLFLQQLNLTLTTSIFGKPSSYEILKFPGGVTVNLEPYATFWNMQQILFNFTLNNSMADIHDNYAELKDELKLWLRLQSYENLHMQATNNDGSTITSPVTVQAALTSSLGSLRPQRLKQLAQVITRTSSAKNLGLDNSVFGKVKEISLSSYLNHTLQPSPLNPIAQAPSPSKQNEHLVPSASPHHFLSPYSPSPSPLSDYSYEPTPSPKSAPHISFPPFQNAPAPSRVIAHRPRPCAYRGGRISPKGSPGFYFEPPVANPPSSFTGCISPSSPHIPPMPTASYGSNTGQGKGRGKGLISPSLSPSSFSQLSSGSSYKESLVLYFSGLAMFLVLCW